MKSGNIVKNIIDAWDNLLFDVLKFILPLSVLCVITVQLSAKSPREDRLALTVNEGLSYNTINSCLRDSHGFIWIGTSYGLNLYDGQKVRRVIPEISEFSFVPPNFYLSLFEANDSIIFVGTNEGVFSYVSSVDSWQHHSSDSGKPIKNVSVIKQNRAGEIYFMSGDGFYMLDETTGNLKEVLLNYVPGSNTNIRAFGFDDETDHLILSRGLPSQIFIIDQIKRTYMLVPFYNNEELTVYAMTVRGDTLWVATGSGLYMSSNYNNDEIRIVADLDFLSKTKVNAILQESDGKIWIGTAKSGLLLYDPMTGEYNFQESFEKKAIRTLYLAPSGELWVGTVFHGLHMLQQSDIDFTGFSKGESMLDLDGNVVSDVYQDHFGSIWVGTDNNGLYLHNRLTNKFTTFLKDDKQIFSNTVTNITEDKDGNVWVATYNGGINKYSYKPNGEVWVERPAFIRSDDLIGYHVSDLFIDSQNIMWVCNNEDGRRGLLLFDLDRQTMIRSFNHDAKDPQSLLSDAVELVFEDSQNRIWIGSKGAGLDLYLPEIQGFRHFATEETSFKNGFITEIFESADGTLWVGTINGLYYFNGEDDFQLVSDNSGDLADLFIMSIEEEPAGVLWVSTNKGLRQYSYKTNEITAYMVTEGLKSNQFCLRSSCRLSQENLLFGTINGVEILSPEKMELNITPNDVYISAIQIGGVKDHINIPLNGTKYYKLDLAYNMNSFTIGYVSPGFHAKGRVKYAYKVEGRFDDWILVDDNNQVTFSELPPGKYTFYVKSFIGDSNEDYHLASVDIFISSPYWDTWWFKLFLLIVLLSAAYGTYYFRIQSFRKNKIILKQLVNKRTGELEKEKERAINYTKRLEIQNHELETQKSELKILSGKLEESNKSKLSFFTNISHEFRTPLTLILLPLSRILDSGIASRIVQQHLKIVYKNALRLKRLTDQILEFRKIQEGKAQYLFINCRVVNLTHEIFNSFKGYAKHKSIVYTFSSKIIADVDWVLDVDKFESIISNLLSNALKYTPEKGEVELMLDQEDGQLVIKVMDNGSSISKEDVLHIFTNFYQGTNSDSAKGTGIGLSIAYEYTCGHNGIIDVALGDEDSKWSTVFSVKIPDNLTPSERSEQKTSFLNNSKLFIEDFGIEPEEEVSSEINNMISPTILLVEDNNELRNYLLKILKTRYSAASLSNGEEAWEWCLKHSPDLIISDIMMPGLDGIALCKRLKTNIITSHIPVLLLTAKASDAHVMEGIQAGADDYLKKPFDEAFLLAKVESVLKNRERLKSASSVSEKCEANQYADSLENTFLQKVYDMITENASNADFSIEYLTEDLAMSKSQLYRKLKSMTGMSAKELLIHMRLQKAELLLKSSKLNVSEVAYETGFSTPSYFTRIFQKTYGTSPKEYRQRHAANI